MVDTADIHRAPLLGKIATLEARWNAGFAEFLDGIGVDGSTIDLVAALNICDELRSKLDAACNAISKLGFSPDDYGGTDDLANCVEKLVAEHRELRAEVERLGKIKTAAIGAAQFPEGGTMRAALRAYRDSAPTPIPEPVKP